MFDSLFLGGYCPEDAVVVAARYCNLTLELAVLLFDAELCLSGRVVASASVHDWPLGDRSRTSSFRSFA